MNHGVNEAGDVMQTLSNKGPTGLTMNELQQQLDAIGCSFHITFNEKFIVLHHPKVDSNHHYFEVRYDNSFKYYVGRYAGSRTFQLPCRFPTSKRFVF